MLHEATNTGHRKDTERIERWLIEVSEIGVPFLHRYTSGGGRKVLSDQLHHRWNFVTTRTLLSSSLPSSQYYLISYRMFYISTHSLAIHNNFKVSNVVLL